ncbi:response regulator [Patescibacteria group bacterium]|nr:response regulator [Patescibacteria group bacterium]
MVPLMKQWFWKIKGHYSKREWRIAAALAFFYILVFLLASQVLPLSARFNPASAIALAALYFGGTRLWPVVYFAALVSQLVTGAPITAILLLPLIETIQATLGSWLLHKAHIDPLFRRYRDTFYFIFTIIGISAIGSILKMVVRLLRAEPDIFMAGWYAYIASLFCFLILTPFLLRWFTKPRFSRTPIEILEIFSVFTALIVIDYTLFIRGIGIVASVPLIYFILIPLFWIALKLRPRFVTLALVITSVFAVAGVLLHAPPDMLVASLYQIEILIIVLAIMFFIVTSLEEDRRVNTNIMHSQMATLRNAVAKESSESKAKNDFIAILSHELRNPLAPILSSIDLLKLKNSRDPEDMELLEMMEDRMSTIRRLLDDLLDISRISEGKIALKKDAVELASVLKRAVLSTEHHRKELHQRLVTRFPQKPLSIIGDAVRLEQIFSNLLTNASKFSSSGDTMTLSMRENDGVAEIEVVDRGIGIRPEELESIFLPFRQLQEGERTKKGLGIGLSLVRNFVEMHNGTIQAHSEGRGRGSRFVVRLPLMGSVEDKKMHEGTLTTQTKGDKKNPTVLIVDDNDAAAGGIGRLLEFQGYKVAYAYDGNQGIMKARSVSPDAIFLDIGLPDLDGWRVAKQLRAQGFKGRLIALTGYGIENSKTVDREVRFDHYLVKPVGLADLQRVLAGLV